MRAAADDATMTLAYYPGCSMHGTSREFDESLRAVAAALDVGLTEIDDWTCCGASSAHADRPPARRGAAGAQPGAGRGTGRRRSLAPCAACYNRLAAAAHELAAEEPAWPRRMPDILGPPVRQLGARAQRRRAAAGSRAASSRSASPRVCEPNPLEQPQARRLLRLPAGAPGGDHRLRRPRAADRMDDVDRRLRRRRR